MGSIELFHPLIRQWFAAEIGEPTEIQQLAWPRIANNEHVLVVAPTGSGKTLTAFLWALNQLVTHAWSTGRTRVVYVSPLKALNNDIQRNLLAPLRELRQVFEEQGERFSHIRVLTRSGDTPQLERRRMLRQPPEILITTPESLNLLLSSQGGRSILGDVRSVILDEVHAVVGNRRGTHLITAVERLAALSGEFQRVALSATVKPEETVAAFVGGFQNIGSVVVPRYVPRTVSVVRSCVTKKYDIRVTYPEKAAQDATKQAFLQQLVDDIKLRMASNTSSLLFVNNRKLCEKLTLLMNADEDSPIAYAHHGSLSRKIRQVVEQKLKAGELKAIVATNSLELGVDVGALDEVFLVQSPPAVSSAIQRVGRAGHSVGQVSKGTLLPTDAHDFLEAAVLAACVLDQDIEPVRPIAAPLDVLAQILVSMTGVEPWDVDALYANVRLSYPYNDLSRTQFDLVLNMLAGRYADTRVRELKPRLAIDRVDNIVRARKGALLALYMAGGVIPDRGAYTLRHQDSNARIGELDEVFVWEARLGQVFTLGAQNWKISKITHNDVYVAPAPPDTGSAPFWIGEEMGRDFHFSQHIATFLEQAELSLQAGDSTFETKLRTEHHMDNHASQQLMEYLGQQRETTNAPLPHRHHVLVERVASGPGGLPGNQFVIHNYWGLRVNRPYSLALEAAWEEQFGRKAEIFAANDCLVLVLPRETSPQEISSEELLSLVTPANLEPMLKKRLQGSGMFGARFRECAGRALLLSKHKLNQRMPLWMNRLRSQKLLAAVEKYEDFPILLEAWRTCLQDEFEMAPLARLLSELESGVIHWTEARTSTPSPMARSTAWRNINEYMYRDDTPLEGGGKVGVTPGLRGDLLQEVVFTPELRPTITHDTVVNFERKRQRLQVGYAPVTSVELLEWVKERVFIPEEEWSLLLQAIMRDAVHSADEIVEELQGKLARVLVQGSRVALVAAVELLPELERVFYAGDGCATYEFLNGEPVVMPDKEMESERDELAMNFLAQWLSFYGPRVPEFLCDTLGLEQGYVALLVEDLLEARVLITGTLTENTLANEICDAENFEILLRMARADRLPAFEALELTQLQAYLALYQGLAGTQAGNNTGVEGLSQRMEQLLCLPLPAQLWEKDVLPARLKEYDPSWMDTIIQEGELQWTGHANKQVAFCLEQDRDLAQKETINMEELRVTPELDAIFPDKSGRYPFFSLVTASQNNASSMNDIIWEHVWQGNVSNDTFLALRRGVENDFSMPKVAQTKQSASGFKGGSGGSVSRGGRGCRGSRRGRLSRSGEARWKGAVPSIGNWFRTPVVELSHDILEQEERHKERVRLLMDRYGILFRELLRKEVSPFTWAELFRTLRLMELSGEILAGYFFKDIPGPQFITHQAFRRLQQRPPESTYWLNAMDPASLCGLPLPAIKATHPKRVPGTYVSFCGARPILTCLRQGKELTFHVAPDYPELLTALEPLVHVLTRHFQPARSIKVESINNESATQSPYLDVLRICFDVVVDYKDVALYKCRK